MLCAAFFFGDVECLLQSFVFNVFFSQLCLLLTSCYPVILLPVGRMVYVARTGSRPCFAQRHSVPTVPPIVSACILFRDVVVPYYVAMGYV